LKSHFFSVLLPPLPLNIVLLHNGWSVCSVLFCSVEFRFPCLFRIRAESPATNPKPAGFGNLHLLFEGLLVAASAEGRPLTLSSNLSLTFMSIFGQSLFALAHTHDSGVGLYYIVTLGVLIVSSISPSTFTSSYFAVGHMRAQEFPGPLI